MTAAAKRIDLSPQGLILDLLALCWYPFAHGHTLMRALGMKACDPAFLDEQGGHLGELVASDDTQRARATVAASACMTIRT